nr:putative ribonuclease H-like domain-containing protein [Tanacetum cinerariifolium]
MFQQDTIRAYSSNLGAKGDVGFFIGYSANFVTYIVYNWRTKKIIETINVTFDKLSAMDFEQNNSRPSLQSMTSGQISFELDLTYAPSTITPQRPSERDLDILFEPLHNEYLGGRPSVAPRAIPAALVKEKKASHPPNSVPNSKQRLHLLHMDLCGPMRVASINGKRYVLVIIDDYSRYTWVHFLRTKDETPEVIKNFLKKIYIRLQALVIIVHTDNGTEFKNQVLKEYFDSVGITHETFAAKTPQQNGVAERRNRTLVEAARTMLIFSYASLFLWAEAIDIACYTQTIS